MQSWFDCSAGEVCTEIKLPRVLTTNRLEQFLCLSERKQLANFSYTRRRQQWFAGRIAAKLSIGRLLGSSDYQRFLIRKGCDESSFGKPVTNIDGVHISISHSGGVALAGASRKVIGLDVEKIKDYNECRESFLFIDNDELARFSEIFDVCFLDQGTLATLAWSIKEACVKCAGLSMFQHRRMFRLVGGTFATQSGHGEVEVEIDSALFNELTLETTFMSVKFIVSSAYVYSLAYYSN